MQRVLQGADEDLAAVVRRYLALFYQRNRRHQRLNRQWKITYRQAHVDSDIGRVMLSKSKRNITLQQQHLFNSLFQDNQSRPVSER